jgi:mannosyltransferase
MKRLSTSFWAIVLCLLGTGLRLYHLTAASLSGDEGWVWAIARKPVAEWLRTIAGDDHPPLYYLILRPWNLAAGNSELAYRIVSVFAGVVAIAAVYRLARRLFGPRAGLMAAALLTLSSQHVDFSQEARMYTLLTALCLTAALALWQAMTDAGSWRNAWKPWLAYLLLMSGAVYTHYYGWLLWATAVGGTILILRGRRLFEALVVHGLVVVAFVPWALYANVLVRSSLPTPGQGLIYWPSALDIASLIDKSFNLLGATPIGLAALGGWLTWLAAGAAVLLLALRPGYRRGLLFTGLHLTAPIGMALLLACISSGVSFRFFGAHDSGTYRYFLPLVPWFCCLVAAGLSSIRPRVLVFAGLAIFAAAEAYPTAQYLVAPRHNKSDYREMVSYVRANWQAGDGVFILGNTQGGLFPYYAPDIPFSLFSPDRVLDASAIPPYQAWIARRATSHTRLWVLVYGSESTYDPGHVVESWLDQTSFITFRQWYYTGELRLYTLGQAGPPKHLVIDALLNGNIRCRDVDLNASKLHPGDTLTLTIYWQPNVVPREDYVVFVHVLDANGALVAQHDGEPVGGTRPTSSWLAGETIADRHAIVLPPDQPAGSYVLQAGLTFPGQPTQRLPVTGPDAQPAGDAVRLATLEVTP